MVEVCVFEQSLGVNLKLKRFQDKGLVIHDESGSYLCVGVRILLMLPPRVHWVVFNVLHQLVEAEIVLGALRGLAWREVAVVQLIRDLLVLEIDFQRKSRAHIDHRLDGDLAAEEIGEPRADVQAEAVAVGIQALGGGVDHAAEALEQLVEVFGRDADALVDDADRQLAAVPH